MAAIIDFSSRTYLYLSGSWEEILGHRLKEFKNNGFDMTIKLYPYTHACIFKSEIYPLLIEILKRHSSNEEARKLKVTYTTQVKVKDGSYKWFVSQLSFLELDDNGKPIIALKMMNEIEGIKRGTSIDLIISKKNEAGIFKVIFEKKFHPDLFSTNITIREREILQLVSQGFSGKKIADNLFISAHTVYTHKKNMLKKFELSSSSELVRFALANGIIG